ncbi:MAG: PAS domain S-box-containing protein [Paracoccaceae bacterium]
MLHEPSKPRGKRRLRTMPIALLSGSVLMLILTLMMGLSYETSTRFRQIEEGWQDYTKDADPRGIWISDIRGYFGYGGMIHNFKNYVLRRDQKYARTLRIQTDLLRKAIGAYQNAGPSPLEQKALIRIHGVVEEYAQQIDKIALGIRQGLSAEQIDAIVRVEDADALRALALLERNWRDQRQRNLNDIVAALSEGETLVRYLTGAMVLLTVLVGLLALLFSILVGGSLRSNAAQIRELKARKQAEEEERKLAWVVQQSPASILITDTRGKIEFVNRKLLEMTGYSESELVGHSPSLLKSGHTPEAAYRDIWARLREGHPWSGVFKNLRKDGSHYWASTQLLPLLDQDNNITNYIGVGEDISEKIRVDEQIAQVQKMEAVGILAGSVAHDFNNVLMTIIGNTELIKLEVDDLADSAEIAASVDQIEIASRRVRALIQQLLTFARQQPGQPQRLDLLQAIEEVLELIRVSTPPRVQIDLIASDQALATDIDPTAFFQIIMNLCHNAVEAIGDRGGAITLQLGQIAPGGDGGLDTLPKAAIGSLSITIHDDGPGIPLDLQNKVFEPFFSTKPVGKGTGLGLAIVRNWVEEAEGRVTLQSSRATGTTFTLVFPQFEMLDSAVAVPDQPPRGQEHILLVDDEEALLYTIRRMMARLGYRVEAFSDPALALQAFRINPQSYDLVATDMIMPEMSGDELIVAIRDIRPDVPVMVISSFHATGSFPPGFEDVRKVAKPVNLAGLAMALRQVIDGTD